MNPGDVIADRFEVEYLAGEGGMGVVYRARDRRRDRPVAIKVLHDDRQSRSLRFEREAELLAALEHPAIVHYVAHGTTEAGRPFLVMDWLEGESLGARLSASRLTIEESVRLGRRVAEALGHAHDRGVVHRDLKPSNLILVGGAIDGVTLVDFGIARLPGRTVTETGAMLGTVGYMAPEQARGEPNVDARADVFAFGAVLFRCLTGKAAFDGPDPLSILLRLTEADPVRPRSVRPEVPRALDDLVARMLSRSPELRPADGHAVARALETIAASPQDAAGIEPPTRAPNVAGALLGAHDPRAALTVVAAARARAPRLSARTFAIIAVSSAIAAAATAGAFWLVDRPRSRAPAVASSEACQFDVCEPVSFPHPEAMDVKELIHASTAFAQRHEPTARLISAQATKLKDGTVDVRHAATTGFTFMFSRRGAFAGKDIGGLLIGFGNGMITMQNFSKYMGSAPRSGLPEPGCGSRAAWLVASHHGLTSNANVVLAYATLRGRAGWMFTAVDSEAPKPVIIDASDCRLTSP